MTATLADAPSPGTFNTSDWCILSALLLLALILRLAFFNGAFGSDDLVYLNRSVQVSQGLWSSANYNGALRYGFNIPAGFLMYLFGVNELAANLWPLFCSLAEIALVYVFALSQWGRRAALYAALVLAFMPLHVAVATRIHADPVVACFLTLSFILFYFAQMQRSRALFFFCGIAMGLVFWTKELAVVALLAFIAYPLIWRQLEARWLYLLGGGLCMLVCHLALMNFIAGDPLHAFKVVAGQVNHSFIEGGDAAEDGAWFYFKYLFLDIKHTFLAGILAAVAVLGIGLCWCLSLNLRRGRLHSLPLDAGTAYTLFWMVTLLGLLSFFPVSLTPFKLIMKQSNYLTLFLAPLALLAGYQIDKMRHRQGLMVLSITLAGSFFLAGLEQQAYRVFTSNSKAVLGFARRHPGAMLVGSNNNGNIAAMDAMFHQDHPVNFRYMSDLPQRSNSVSTAANAAFAVIDQQTMGWGKHALSLAMAPDCWLKLATLEPDGFGLALPMIQMLTPAAAWLPSALGRRAQSVFQQLSRPAPAIVYRVNMANFWCQKNDSR